MPPLPVPSEALSSGSPLAPSYSVLHACLVLGGDVPSCVAQASAYGPLLRNQTQLSIPTAQDVTPTAIADILKIHPFAQIIQELQGDDGVEAVIDKTPLSENDKVILEFLRQQNMSSSLMDRVITQVNNIKDTFKDSQVNLPFWGDGEKEKEGEEGQENADGPTINSSGLQIKLESSPGTERHNLEEMDKHETQGSVPFAAVTIQSSFNVKEKGKEGSGKKKEEKDDKGEQGKEDKDDKPERIRTSTDRRGLLIRSRFPHAQVVFPRDPEPVRFHLVP